MSGSLGSSGQVLILTWNPDKFYWDEDEDKFKIVLSTSDDSSVTNITDSEYTRLAGADPVDAQDFITLNYLATAKLPLALTSGTCRGGGRKHSTKGRCTSVAQA